MEPGRTPSEPAVKSSASVRNAVSVATSISGRLLRLLVPGRSSLSPVAKSVMVSMVVWDESVRGLLKPKLKLSLPAPPVSRSAPRPPTSRSSPAPPDRVSLLSPPKRLSLPSPPDKVSLPASPLRLSLPALPLRLSSPRPPVRVSLPAPPVRLSAAKPPVARMAPKGALAPTVTALASSTKPSPATWMLASNTGALVSPVKMPLATVRRTVPPVPIWKFSTPVTVVAVNTTALA